MLLKIIFIIFGIQGYLCVLNHRRFSRNHRHRRNFKRNLRLKLRYNSLRFNYNSVI